MKCIMSPKVWTLRSSSTVPRSIPTTTARRSRAKSIIPIAPSARPATSGANMLVVSALNAFMATAASLSELMSSGLISGASPNASPSPSRNAVTSSPADLPPISRNGAMSACGSPASKPLAMTAATSSTREVFSCSSEMPSLRKSSIFAAAPSPPPSALSRLMASFSKNLVAASMLLPFCLSAKSHCWTASVEMPSRRARSWMLDPYSTIRRIPSSTATTLTRLASLFCSSSPRAPATSLPLLPASFLASLSPWVNAEMLSPSVAMSEGPAINFSLSRLPRPASPPARRWPPNRRRVHPAPPRARSGR